MNDVGKCQTLGATPPKAGDLLKAIRYLKDATIWVRMSNGGTEVLSNVLALAGAELAKTEREIFLVLWLSAQLDQFSGRGTVGFDLHDDFPWSERSFDLDRRFLVSLVDAAKKETGWKKLPYVPTREIIFENLNKLENLLNLITLDVSCLKNKNMNIIKHSIFEPDELPKNPKRCEEHNTFQHEIWGLPMCVVCNNTEGMTK